VKLPSRTPGGHGRGVPALAVVACAWLVPASAAAQSLPGDEGVVAPASELVLDLIAPAREVEVRWVARELRGLEGYRLTATVDRGFLTGLVGGRTVERTVRAALDGHGGLRAYRVQLVVQGERHSHVRIALEAMGRETSSAPLAVRESALDNIGRSAGHVLSPAGSNSVTSNDEPGTPRGVVPPPIDIGSRIPIFGDALCASGWAPEERTEAATKLAETPSSRGPPA
jgi:hypothetical protein